MKFAMRPKSRLNLFVDDSRKIIIVRPIGPLPASEFIDQVFKACANIPAPWTYSRLNDFRRFETTLADEHLHEMATRWAEITQGHDDLTRVALVRLDSWNEVRLPNISPLFPKDTLCVFTDYHEAMGWLMASDSEAYLEHLRANPVARPDDFSIQIS
jgi:hypothetical protein